MVTVVTWMVLLVPLLLLVLTPTPARALELELVVDDGTTPLPYALELSGATFRVSIDLVELVGGQVVVDGSDIHVQAGGREAHFEIGSNMAVIDGQSTRMFATVRSGDDGLFIPLVDLAHFLGFNSVYVGGNVVLRPRTEALAWLDVILPGPAEPDGEESPDPQPDPDPEPMDEGTVDETPDAMDAPWADALSERVGEAWQAVSARVVRIVSVDSEPVERVPIVGSGQGEIVRFREIPLQPGARLYAARTHTIDVTWEAGIRAVRIEASAPFTIHPPYKRESPGQLIFDIEGLDTGHANGRAPVDDIVVKGLRLGQNDVDIVRLVIELDTLVGVHKIEHSEDGMSAAIYINVPVRSIDAQFDVAGGTLHIDVPGTHAYSISRYQEPERIVIDLPGTTLVGDPLHFNSDGGGPVLGVRVHQNSESITRVVLDVERYLDLVAERGGSQLVFHAAHIIEGIHYAFFDFGLILWIEGSHLPEPQINQWPGVDGGLDRLVVDLPGMVHNATWSGYELPPNALGPGIRLGQTPQYARLVVDVFHPVQYHVMSLPERQGVALILLNPVTSLADRKVYIDPGHGGRFPGTIGVTTGIREAEVVLDISLMLGALLQEAGAEVIYSRTEDRNHFDNNSLDLVYRREHSRNSGADLFISVHANAAERHTAGGTETYISPPEHQHPDDFDLATRVQAGMVKALGTFDRGVHIGNFAVLRDGSLPRILVEVAFLSNPVEEALLLDKGFQRRAAEGILQGIVAYFVDQEKGPVEPTADELTRYERAVQQALDDGQFHTLPLREDLL